MKAGIQGFLRKQESRVPGENRDPVSEMVPCFRRDNVWTPALAGVTVFGLFTNSSRNNLTEIVA
ncbi:MAG: hypothetical protein A2W09_01660 [Deltaproteobacteria bacterium RBG_16_50_11]|nr:MAG: hypothetical protein A2W09_01660 [Deltaproteobacteria bacterium RBG_16_50_11]